MNLRKTLLLFVLANLSVLSFALSKSNNDSDAIHGKRFLSKQAATALGDKADKDIRSKREVERESKKFRKALKNDLVIKLKELALKKKFNKAEVIKTYNAFLEDWKKDGLVTDELIKVILEKVKRQGISNRVDTVAEKLTKLTLQEDVRVLKANDPCSQVIDKCSKNAFCQNVQGKFKCVEKVALENRCQPDLNQCLDGTCRLMLRYSDVNLCQTYGEKCSSASECCSNTCNSNGRCEADYRCTKCLGIGKKITGKTEKCCSGLYPNEKKICEPIIPIYGLLNSILSAFFTEAHASVADDIASVRSELSSKVSQLSSKLSSATISSSDKSQIISKYNSRISNCYDADRSSSAELSCLNGIKTEITSAIAQVGGINAYLSNFDKEIANLKEEAKGLDNLRGNSTELTRLISHHQSQRNNCVKKANMWPRGTRTYTETISSIKSCLDNVNKYIKQQASEITNNVNQLKMQLYDKNAASLGAIQQGIDMSDHSLYDRYDDAAPILGNIAVSDMENCRVNLFGDYLVKQPDDYFNVMISLLGMDFVTSGQGVSDYFTLDNWRMQTQTQEQDIETFDADNIKADIFQTYANDIKKIVQDYYDTLDADQKKIWGFLFNNGFIKDKEKQAIMRYFVEGDASKLDTDLENMTLPTVSSYNIHKITRFEAVKYKFHIFQLYGKLKKKSLEMTCRCVDTMGPMKGDEWLKPDVESLYIRTCNGLGKYDKFVVVEDDSCTKVDASGKCINAQSKDYTKKVLEDAELKHGTKNISDADKSSTGRDTVKYKNSDGRDVKEEIASSTVINDLKKLKKTTGKHSKADKFIQNGKVTFESERKENTKGLGEGVVFSEFLRDMAIMKVEALTDAAMNNVFTMSQGLALTSEFVRTYNWGYQKTKVHHYDKVKKYYWHELLLAWLVQLITGNDSNNQAGHFVSGATGTTTFQYDGVNKTMHSAIKDSLTSLHLRPERICEKRKYRSSTWKKSRIPVGKKYYYKCIRNEVLANDVCNAKLPVGLCMKTVYVTNHEGDTSFVIDPFIPEETGLITDDRFLQRKTIRTLTSGNIDTIKVKARKYIKEQFFDFSDDEADQFADFVFKYHFWYPKKSRLVRYMTQGLIPYYERITAKAYNVNMAIFDDLFRTSSYALKMHNFYYNVDRGITNGLLLGQGQLDAQEFDIESGGTPDMVAFMADLNNQGVSRAGTLDFANSDNFNESLSQGIQSDNKSVKDFAGAVSSALDQGSARDRRRKTLDKFMSDNGRSGELEKMKRLQDEKYKEYDLVSKNLAASLRRTANTRSQFKDGGGLFDFSKVAASSLGPSSYGKRGRRGSDSSASSSDSSDALINAPITIAKKKGSKKKGSSSKGGKTAIADTTLDELDFSDLDGDELGEYSFGANGQKISSKELKKYFAQQGIDGKNDPDSSAMANAMDGDNWDNDERSLFEKVSNRYKKSAFPRFLFKRRKLK